MGCRAAPLPFWALECRFAVALATTRISVIEARLPGSHCLVVCYRRVASCFGRSGSLRQPCRGLDRRRSVALAASFFYRLLCLRCSRIRALTVRRGLLF